MAGERDCSVCFRKTKYSCLKCDLPTCNLCGVEELNEEIEGWTAGKKVGYCPDCKVIDKCVRKKPISMKFVKGQKGASKAKTDSEETPEVSTHDNERYIHIFHCS